MKRHFGFLFVLLIMAISVHLQGQTVPRNSTMTVKLLAPLSTKTNEAGDKISAQVVDPPGFKGDMVSGEVKKVKNGGKIHGTSVLNFIFDKLYHQDKTITIESNVLSLINSHGQENVDEEGQVIDKKNNIGKVALGTAAGGLLGGILGGAKGAAIGAGIGMAGSLILVETTVKGPSISFAAGSEFVLSVQERSESGQSLQQAARQTEETSNVAAPTQSEPVEPVATPNEGTSSDAAATQSTAVEPAAQPAMTSSSDCTGPGTTTVSNGTHGTINIQAGTGSFANLSPAVKAISVAAGSPISGTVQLNVTNSGPSFAVAPLIWTPSWGDPANSWRMIQGWVRDGTQTLAGTIEVAAPQTPGTYHILFAFQMETNGQSVASATNWALGHPVWGDGNDIADFDQQQINEAQQFGCTINNWLVQTGHQLTYVPADAITVVVGSSTAIPQGGLQPVPNSLPASQDGEANLIRDDFAQEKGLDPAQWQTSTPLLAALARAQSSRFVEPQLTFDSLGMRMIGVSGTYQFAGLQSKLSFSPPFTARATVMGTVAHGNAFVIYVVGNGPGQSLKIEANLNPENGQYRGLWIAHGNAPGVNVFQNTVLNDWYTLVLSVDALGVGTANILDSHGSILATKGNYALGTGSFFLILGQREGAPFTVGPNEAVWSSVEVVPSTNSSSGPNP